MAEKEKKLTPMVRQYLDIKKNYQDTILFYRLGDFYEMFYDDAVLCSRELELTLTSRNVGELSRIPMCGVPFHAAESYISKLIRKGYKVAVCEQVEDPKQAKKLVKRDVIQVITPGTTLDFNVLNQKSNNYLMSLFFSDKKIAVALTDVSTGEFLVSDEMTDKMINFLENRIAKFKPAEVLLPESLADNDVVKQIFSLYPDILITKYYDWVYEKGYAVNKLLEHFQVKSLNSFGIENRFEIISAAAAALHYINETQKQVIKHIDSIKLYSESDFMILDNATVRNLELVANLQDNTSARTLFSVLDYTKTPQGARLLKKRILEPLMSVEKINNRLKKVNTFFSNSDLLSQTQNILNKISDMERLGSRISLFKTNPRDVIALKNSLINFIKLKELLNNVEILKDISDDLPDVSDIIDLIDKSINEEAPVQLGKGMVIKEGYNEEFDKYKKAEQEGKEWILNLQKNEIERTGISSLKIKYNKVFGYYIEVTKTNLDMVPDDYVRKQTLTNAERFTFPKLQEYEEIILNAAEKVVELENTLFNEILEIIGNRVGDIKKVSHYVASVDFYTALAECAVKNNYNKPVINKSDTIEIKEGRHPVVEKTVKDEQFIPNDTLLNSTDNMILIITGPNMAGKSTYLRQVALITLMAQMGSFVPASNAKIGVVDRIFTRVGASDNLARGESTFLVEMNETANILNNATDKSLIIMDEIGRGTSTYDGLSIAWSVVEYINNTIKAKTLFATHYHELTQLGSVKGIKNYNILVREWGDKVIFLRKIEPGAADKSYGIQVAQLAGIPKDVILRAKEILTDLEEDSVENVILSQSALQKNDEDQLNLFSMKLINPVEAEINKLLKDVDINNLTPIEALQILSDIKKKIIGD